MQKDAPLSDRDERPFTIMQHLRIGGSYVQKLSPRNLEGKKGFYKTAAPRNM